MVLAELSADIFPPGRIDGAPPDAPPTPDARARDAARADAGGPSGIGDVCPTGTECAVGQFCLDENSDSAFPPDGYCTRSCTGPLDCPAAPA